LQQGIQAEGSSTNKNHGLATMDITIIESVRQVIEKARPDCVINCAAMTNVDECERNPDQARSINIKGVENLAKICSFMGVRLVHVSTDSIFDGKTGGYSEESKPMPINTYARTKVEGEKLVSSIARSFAIVRTNFYGINPNGKHFLNWILSSLKEGKEMIGFEDAVFNPLWVSDLARLLVELAGNPYNGIINFSSDERFSKYEFIRHVATELGYGNSIVKKGLSAQITLAAARPKITTLSNKRMHELLKTKIHKCICYRRNRLQS
jgi:dTDP-4-dehydrorhamnose reductase